MSSGGPHICPGCGERVSAFAAGCALCGADLDPRRGQRPPTVIARLRRHLSALPGHPPARREEFRPVGRR